jgi:hypothetical protein
VLIWPRPCTRYGGVSGLVELAEHCGPQHVEAYWSYVQDTAMETLEIEVSGFSRSRVLTQLQQDSFPDLVRRGLTGPTEVAVQFETQERFIARIVCGQQLPGLLAVPCTATDLGWGVELAVEAYAEDYPGRAQRLGVEHPQVVGRVPSQLGNYKIADIPGHAPLPRF